MNTRDVLDAIGGDPELLDIHDRNPEFKNLVTHVAQASTGAEAVQTLCRGLLAPSRHPELLTTAVLAPSTDPLHP